MNNLFEEIISDSNLRDAWLKVAANQGSEGIDKISIEQFKLNLTTNISTLQNLLLSNEYKPLPLLKFEHKKKNGEKRIIGIPSVRDRLVQQAIINIIEPIYEPIFLDCSYAYRKGKSAHKAINRIEKMLKRGKIYIVSADIKSFFDKVDHKILLNLIQEKIKNERVLNLLKIILKEEAIRDGKGLAQGAVTSPLLSNVYLNELDEEMIKNNLSFVRYADDFVVLFSKQAEAEKRFNEIKSYLKNNLKLELNISKTSIGNLDKGFVFLGYKFGAFGKRPSKEALQDFVTKLYSQKELKSVKTSLPSVADRVKAIWNGWKGYFHIDGVVTAEIISQLENRLLESQDAIPLRIVFISSLIQTGQLEKAKKVLLDTKEIVTDDPRIHYEWGILSESLGLESQAMDEFFVALRLKPEDKNVLFSIGRLYLKKKKLSNAIKFLQKTIEYDYSFKEAYILLAKIYQDLGLKGLERAVKSVISESVEDIEESTTNSSENSSTINNYSLIIHLFTGREGVYARGWKNPDGRIGYFPNKKSLDENIIKKHLNGEEFVGIYLLRMDNTINFAVIDIDIAKNQFKTTAQESLSEEARDTAYKIKNFSKKMNIETYIEETGGRGFHCWFFFSSPLKASTARNFLKFIIRHLNNNSSKIEMEIFPKQDKIAKDALGPLIRLPLGIHPLTGRRSFFLNGKRERAKDIETFLKSVRKISVLDISKAIQNSIHKELYVVNETDPYISRILHGCNVLRYLLTKAKTTHELRHTERLVILYVFSHLGERGKKFIHYVMSFCTNYSYNYTQKWIYKTSPRYRPISCPKIRDWLSYITPAVGCYCKFKLEKEEYPNPLLYIKGLQDAEAQNTYRTNNDKKLPLQGTVTNDKKETKTKDLSNNLSKKINEILLHYLELKKHRNEIVKEIAFKKNFLEKVLKENNISKVETNIGTLKKIDNCWIIEL